MALNFVPVFSLRFCNTGRQTCGLCVTMRTGPPRVSRRQVLGNLSAAVLALATTNGLTSEPALAESMLESQVRTKVTVLLECRQKAISLREKLVADGSGTMSQEDQEYLARATAVWLTPAVDALNRLAKGDVDVGPGMDAFSKVLPIHLAELADERRAGRRDGAIRELTEYLETVEEVLRKEGLARFVAGKRWNGKEWTTMVL